MVRKRQNRSVVSQKACCITYLRNTTLICQSKMAIDSLMESKLTRSLGCKVSKCLRNPRAPWVALSVELGAQRIVHWRRQASAVTALNQYPRPTYPFILGSQPLFFLSLSYTYSTPPKPELFTPQILQQHGLSCLCSCISTQKWQFSSIPEHTFCNEQAGVLLPVTTASGCAQLSCRRS